MRSRVAFLVMCAWLVTGAATARAEPGDPVRLRVGTLAIEGSRYAKDMGALAAEISKRTRGAVQLDWAWGGRLGDEDVMARAIIRGELDGGGFSETGLDVLVPEMAAWGAPGLFRDYDQVDRATAALGASTRERFARRDLVFAMWADLGFSYVFSRQPIATLGEGVRVAAPWRDLPLGDQLTQEILSGRARAWTLPPLYMIAIGHTKARYMTNLRYRYLVGGLVFSRPAWERLTPAQRAMVLEVCAAWEGKLRRSWRKETERGLATLIKSGVILRSATEAQLAAFGESLVSGREPSALETQIRAARDAK